MAITIGKNITSLGVQRYLSESTSALSDASNRLASGLRINKASDDAAGLAIATSLNADTKILNQGLRNLNDGLSYLNIAQGSVEALSHITTRQLELAEQAANGSYSAAQRGALNTEAQALRSEYNRILDTTVFNGQRIYQSAPVLDPLVLQAGYGAGSTISITLGTSLATATASGSYSGSGTFASTSSAVANADFNGDGIEDLFSYNNTGASTYQLQLANGDGTFRQGQALTMAFNRVVVKDFTGDGIADVVGLSEDPSRALWVYRNTGNGTFAPVLSYDGIVNFGGSVDSVIRSGDFNGDGFEDIIVSNYGDSTYVRLNQGDGSLGSAVATGDMGIIAVDNDEAVYGDINGDGLDDILGIPGAGTAYRSYLSNGLGGFSDAGVSTLTVRPHVFGDVTGDGFVDAVYGTGNGFTVRRGIGNGTFAAAVTYGAGGSGSILMADADNDGILDAIQYNTATGAITFTAGTGGGGFASESKASSAGGAITSLAFGDFDGDGVPDLVATNSSAQSTLLVGQSSSATFVAATFDLSTVSDAREALDILRDQLDNVSSELSTIGAAQSRVEVTISVLRSTAENYATARSRIEDSDVAFDAARYLALQIKQQSAVAVLAQANQQPSLVLRLLGASS